MAKDDFFPPEVNSDPKKAKKNKGEKKTKKIHIPLPKKVRKVITKEREGQDTILGSPSKRIKTLWKKAKNAGEKKGLKGFSKDKPDGINWLHNKAINRILKKREVTGAKPNIESLREEIVRAIEEQRKKK